MAYDFSKLLTEVTDLQNVVTAQANAKSALDAATANSASVAQENAAKLAALQTRIEQDQKTADDALQAATVASQVADQLVQKQVAYLVALVQQSVAPGDDPTPDATPSPPKVQPA